MTGTSQLVGLIHHLLALLWQMLNLGLPVPINSPEEKHLPGTIAGSGNPLEITEIFTFLFSSSLP